MTEPPKLPRQLIAGHVEHRRATMWAGMRGLAAFKLVDQSLHFRNAQNLSRFDGGLLTDPNNDLILNG